MITKEDLFGLNYEKDIEDSFIGLPGQVSTEENLVNVEEKGGQHWLKKNGKRLAQELINILLKI